MLVYVGSLGFGEVVVLWVPPLLSIYLDFVYLACFEGLDLGLVGEGSLEVYIGIWRILDGLKAPLCW